MDCACHAAFAHNDLADFLPVRDAPGVPGVLKFGFLNLNLNPNLNERQGGAAAPP
jgi:hypothetical protein